MFASALQHFGEVVICASDKMEEQNTRIHTHTRKTTMARRTDIVIQESTRKKFERKKTRKKREVEENVCKRKSFFFL